MENETEGGNGKEGTLTPSAQDAIGDAAKANVNAAVEVAKSAVSSFVEVFTGERKKPQRGKRRSNEAKRIEISDLQSSWAFNQATLAVRTAEVTHKK